MHDTNFIGICFHEREFKYYELFFLEIKYDELLIILRGLENWKIGTTNVEKKIFPT